MKIEKIWPQFIRNYNETYNNLDDKAEGYKDAVVHFNEFVASGGVDFVRDFEEFRGA